MLRSLLIVLAACDPTVYGGLEDQASTRVAEAPDGYPRGEFGTVLAAFRGDRGSVPISALVVSAGAASPVATYDVWDGNGIVLSGPRDDDCTDAGSCDDGAGSALAGIPVWRRGMLGEGRLCTIIAASTAESVLVQCESTTIADHFVVGGGRAFGAAMVSVAGAASAHAVALIGAPAIGPIDAGRLYRLPDGAAPVEIALPAGVSPAGGHLGTELAAFAIDDQHVLVAAAAIDGGRVVVAEVFDEGAGVQSDVIACIDDPAGGFGGSLLLADLTSDGSPELVVGSAAGATGRLETVRVYPGTGRPGRGTCGPWGAAPADVACPSVQDVGCAASGFGGDLAAGDFDGDSILDLLVGAPFASVESVDRAGAVFVLRGTAGGLDLASARALRFSNPEADDRLGTTVAAAGSLLSSATPRHEPIASAPGRDAFAAFLCSGLPGDEPGIGERCLPM